MPVVVATRMRPRGLRGAWRASRLTRQVAEQLADQPGFLGGAVLAEPRLVFWTVSVWADQSALRRWGVDHAAVAAQGPRVARGLDSTVWRTDAPEVPSWSEVAARWPEFRRPGFGGPLTIRPREPYAAALG